jgi:hypothetical protein
MHAVEHVNYCLIRFRINWCAPGLVAPTPAAFRFTVLDSYLDPPCVQQMSEMYASINDNYTDEGLAPRVRNTMLTLAY